MKRAIYRYRFELIILIFGFFYMLFFSRYGLDIDDEGFFIYVSKLVSQGLIPYKDFSLHTTPGSYYLQGLIFKLFGSTVMVDRYSMIFLGLFVAVMLFYLSRELVSHKYLASISSFIFIFWGITHIRFPWYGWYALAFGVTVPYFVLKYLKTERWLFLFLAGIVCSLTFLMKQNIGTAVIFATFLFSIIKNLFWAADARRKILKIIKEFFILSFGISLPLCVVAIYFYLNGAFDSMLYYIFRHASQSAWNRFIFNPFPHIKSSSLFILFVYLLFCYFSYAYIWKKKLIYGLFVLLISAAALTTWFLFIKKIDSVDSIYILDHLKTGFINGFFNLCMASVLFGGYLFLKRRGKKKESDYRDLAILFVSLWAVCYIWSSLCISRDHLHLVLGMAPSYILVPLFLERTSDRVSCFINNRDKIRGIGISRGYSRFVIIFIPFLFICFTGCFSAFKNEGFRSIFPSMNRMDSTLHIENAEGIRLSGQDRDMIRDIVAYINENTDRDEKIFDCYKSTLFYFLTDRMRPCFHLVLSDGVMRPDEQKEVIEGLEANGVRLVIAERQQWDERGRRVDSEFNPLTHGVWTYIVDNFNIVKDFGKFYILERKQ